MFATIVADSPGTRGCRVLTVQMDHPPLGCLSDEAVASSGDAFSWWRIGPVAELLVWPVRICVYVVASGEGPGGTLDLLELHINVMLLFVAALCRCLIRGRFVMSTDSQRV